MQFLLERGSAGLFLNPGRAKTAIALAATALLRQHKQIRRALVVCPINPMTAVWPVEIGKWDEFRTLGVAVLHGSRKNRILDELDPQISIYVINFEGLKWLVGRISRMKEFPFDLLILDESSHLRDIHTLRYRLLKSLLPLFKRRYIRTGDPSPNSLMDLFGQVYVMDSGATFGPHITKFRI